MAEVASIVDVVAEWRENRNRRRILKNVELHLISSSEKDSAEKLKAARKALNDLDEAYLKSKPILRRIPSTSRLSNTPSRVLLDIITPIESLNQQPGADADELIREGYGASCCEIWKGAIVAVKKINVKEFSDATDGFKDAALIMQSMHNLKKSECLNSFLGAAFYHGIGYFLSPLAPLGTLYNLLHADLPPSEKKAFVATKKISILLDVSSGLRHLHESNVSHGRLKTSNVLIFSGFRAKLSDYGVAGLLTRQSRFEKCGVDGIHWSTPELVKAENNARNEVAKDPSLKLTANTLESFLPCPAGDVYAFGCLIVCILSMRVRPFDNLLWEDAVFAALLRGEIPTIPGSYPDKDSLHSLEPFAITCLANSTETRPDAAALWDTMHTLLCELETEKLKTKEAKQAKVLLDVVDEVANLEKRIAETMLMVTKGGEMISKREMAKTALHDPKERKEAEIAIAKAKAKLATFEKDLDGMRTDLQSAVKDREELTKRHSLTLEQLTGGAERIMRDRGSIEDAYDQKALIQRYLSFELWAKANDALSSERSLRDFVDEASIELDVVNCYKDSLKAEAHHANTYYVAKNNHPDDENESFLGVDLGAMAHELSALIPDFSGKFSLSSSLLPTMGRLGGSSSGGTGAAGPGPGPVRRDSIKAATQFPVGRDNLTGADAKVATDDGPSSLFGFSFSSMFASGANATASNAIQDDPTDSVRLGEMRIGETVTKVFIPLDQSLSVMEGELDRKSKVRESVMREDGVGIAGSGTPSKKFVQMVVRPGEVDSDEDEAYVAQLEAWPEEKPAVVIKGRAQSGVWSKQWSSTLDSIQDSEDMEMDSDDD